VISTRLIGKERKKPKREKTKERNFSHFFIKNKEAPNFFNKYLLANKLSGLFVWQIKKQCLTNW